MTRRDWYAFAFYLSLAVAVGFSDHRVRRFPDHVTTKYIPSVVDGSAEAPGRYRVLAPFVIDGVTRATGASPLVVFLSLRLVFIYGAFVAMHVYLRRWYAFTGAVAGTVAMAALLPLTFTNSWAHPDSMVELVVFTAGCAAVVRGRDGWFAVLLLVAALNRETSAFLLLFWAATRLAADRRADTLARVAVVGAAWFTLFVGLRWWRGFVSYEYWMLPTNLGVLVPLPANFDPYVRISGYMWLFLSVPLFWFGVRGARARGWLSEFGCAVVVSLLLIVVGFTISSVIESRIFTPLFPLLLPPAMAGLGVELADGDARHGH